MKLYTLYIFTSLSVTLIVLLLLGVSAGFANYLPIAALLGSVILLLLAAPILIFNIRFGLRIGLIGCLFIAPYAITFTKSVFDDNVFNWGTLVVMIPILLTSLSIYLTVKYLFFSNSYRELLFGFKTKTLIASLPLILFLLYLFLYGKYWSWEIFRI